MINVTCKNDLIPLPAEFIKWTCPSSIFGILHYKFWQYQNENLKLVKPTVYSLDRLHGYAGCPGSLY